MIVDTCKLKDPYTHMHLNDGKEVSVKLDGEGVVIDIWQDGEVVDSTYKFYQEMVDGE
jgi:hypothetical protein